MLYSYFVKYSQRTLPNRIINTQMLPLLLNTHRDRHLFRTTTMRFSLLLALSLDIVISLSSLFTLLCIYFILCYNNFVPLYLLYKRKRLIKSHASIFSAHFCAFILQYVYRYIIFIFWQQNTELSQ